MPGLLDHRDALEALDHHAALVVDREVHRADHVVAPVARAATPRRRPAAAAGSRGRPRAPGSRTCPSGCRGWALKASSYWALMRPTTRPSRRARNSCASPWEKKAFRRRFRNSRRSSRSGGTQTPEVEWSRYGSSMNSFRSRREATGWTATDTERHPTHMPTAIDVFEKVRGHERSEQLRAAREADLLPYFRRLESPAAPGRGDGGRRADHARLQQLPRPDRRRARHAGGARRARALRDRADRLAAAQRDDRPAPGARARAGGVDGHRGGDRLHHRPPGQPRLPRHAARRRATR